jgi:hypothetical protein
MATYGTDVAAREYEREYERDYEAYFAFACSLKQRTA